MRAAVLLAGGALVSKTRVRHAGSDVHPDLGHVTLVAVSSIALDATVRALRLSGMQARFGAVMLLSDVAPSDDIAWQPIPPIRSRHDYSRFMVHELHQFITTSHMLCVQWDGYVLDGQAWSPDFANYDYIGAPWPHFSDGRAVGNGGFSYRSKRLMEICSRIAEPFGEAEDVLICRSLRPRLEKDFGMRFAPEFVARRFAFERLPRRGDEFGFHGTFNMGDLCEPDEFRQIVDRLEPSVMANNEVRELLIWAARHVRPRLALSLVRRMLARSFGAR